MAGKYKRYYISAATTLVSLFLMLQLIGVQITSPSGDIVCDGTIEDPCISYIKVYNPTAKSIYIYNYDEVSLEFSPEIESYKLYVKYYGKWRFTNFTMETRLGNIPKSRKYVFVFPRYSTKEFMLIGYKKDPSDVVKWTLGMPGDELDPVWGASKETICYNTSQGGKELDLINQNCYLVEYYNKTINNPYYTYNCVVNKTGTGGACDKVICKKGESCNVTRHNNYTVVVANKTTFKSLTQYLLIQGKSFSVSKDNLYCKQKAVSSVNCVSTLDGDKNNFPLPGQSTLTYSISSGNVKYEATDHYKKEYEKEMKNYNVTEESKVSLSVS